MAAGNHTQYLTELQAFADDQFVITSNISAKRLEVAQEVPEVSSSIAETAGRNKNERNENSTGFTVWIRSSFRWTLQPT